MKNLLKVIAVFLLFSSNSFGQQDALVTQYMFNGLYLNPAYAGSHEYWSSTLTYRTQWAGADFDGAPETMIGAVDGPIRGRNMGLGLIVLHDQIGETQQNTFSINYAYQLKLSKKTRLAIGINGGVSQFSGNLRDILIWDENDVIYANNTSILVPKLGVGMYLFNKRNYLGISIPTLFAFDNDKDFSMDLSKASFLRRHYLLTGGTVIDIAKKIKMRPSVLLKYVEAAPLSGDVNLSFVYQDAFWVGVTYRHGDAVSLIFEYQSNNYFRIGYSYDITLSSLRQYSSGSHEIMLGIDFGKDLKKIKTPRYF